MTIPLPSRTFAFIAAAVTFTAGFSEVQAQTYFFDFGSGQATNLDDDLNSWNTVPNSVAMSNDQALDFIFDTSGMTSTLQLQMVSRFNGENANGTEGSSLYPSTATRDSMYGNTAEWQGLSNITPKFKLTGLDPAKAYNFTFYASRMVNGSTEDRTTQYVLTGSAVGSTQLNPLNNVNNVAQLFNVIPDPVADTEFGEVLVELFPGETNANQYKFAYLGVMKVETIPEPTSALMIASGIGILAVRRRRRAA
ncbi:MAG: PEP-CTERM sorting domain-containing protein [Chthoniobacteraceae bacterium]